MQATNGTTHSNGGSQKRAKCDNGTNNGTSNGTAATTNGIQQNGGAGLIGAMPQSVAISTTPGLPTSAAAAAAAAAGIPLYNPYLLPTAAAAQFLPAVSCEY